MAAPDRSQEPRPSEGSWLLRIYELISVSTDDVLSDARGMGIQISKIDELRAVRTTVLDGLAQQYIRNSKLMTSLSGAGLGAGGFMLVGPELSILASNIIRLAQRLSIVYGFDYHRPEESIHVWVALGRALGVESVADGTGKVAVRNLPKLLAHGPGRSAAFKALIKMIAARLGLIVTERGLARALPLVGAGVAAVTNYQLIRDVGGKIQTYFRDRHITEKVSRTKTDPVPDSSRGPGAPDAGGDHPKKKKKIKKLKKAAKTSRKKD